VSRTRTSAIFALNNLPWYARLPCKWLIFGAAVFVVCFPYPRLTYRHFSHWQDPNALVEPNAPALMPWAAELRASLPTDLPAKETLRHVERFVYDKVPYEWDWNTWGLSDYLPTASEVVAAGKEDCDGRAVVAASLLAGLGFQARIVTDFAHVWVQTDHGETMGPGAKKAVVATPEGMKLQWRGLTELPRAIAYGLAVFPWPRQAFVLVITWWLFMSSRFGWVRGGLAFAGLMAGFFLLRAGGQNYYRPVPWAQWLGAATMAASLAMLMVPGLRSRVGNNPQLPAPR
jgi:hypothetical protein